MQKFYRLNYRNEDDQVIVLFDSEDREEVDKKKLAYSFKYNSGKMFIEELYKREEKDEKPVKSDTSLRDGVIMGVSFLTVLLLEFFTNKKNKK